MNLKVKGLLKGLRYISRLFGGREEEKVEMRISFPTDVKHVIHMGCVNGDYAASPTWMNEFNQENRGIESDILKAVARSIEVLTIEETMVSSPRKVIIKTKLGKDSKPPGTRRRKDAKQKDGSSTRASDDPEAKPKKARRRKKKKVIKDGSATSSSTKSVSLKAPSILPTNGEGNLEWVKSGAMYMSAHESSDIEGSTRSYRTVASAWGRDLEEDDEKIYLI